MTTTAVPMLPRTGEVRSPARAWLLTIVTFGAYGVVRHYVVNRELRDFGVEVQPVVSALALFPGGFTLVPALVTLWRTSDRIGVAQETVELVPSSRGPVGALAIVGWLFVPYHQRELNRVWCAER